MTLSPKTSSAVAGTAGTRQLTAVVAPENASNKEVSFSILPETPGLKVSASGLISWTDAVGDGMYTTTVKTAEGSFTDSHILTLTDPNEG